MVLLYFYLPSIARSIASFLLFEPDRSFRSFFTAKYELSVISTTLSVGINIEGSEAWVEEQILVLLFNEELMLSFLSRCFLVGFRNSRT